MNIGEALLSVRKSKGYRQNKVCAKVGITQTYLSQIETGAKTPSIEVIEKICKYYKIPFAVMMWLALSENEVEKNKKEAFRLLKPSIDALVKEAFNC